jgi:tetratricopeptide (TPR) repeat protein
MLKLVRSIVSVLARRFRSRAVLQLENLALRHQLHVLRRQRPARPRLFTIDRLFWVWLYRLSPRCLATMMLVKPATVVQWHRQGFRLYWRWRSGSGLPSVDREVRKLIREMSSANPLWGVREIGASPFDFALALWWSSVLNLQLRDWETARIHADEAISLAHEHGMMSILDLTDTIRGWALGQVGQTEQGLAQMLGCRTQIMQDRTVIAFWLFEGLANSYLAAGNAQKGLETVAEGLELAQHTGRRIFEAELRRLKGELLLMGDNGAAPEAAQCFRDAIEVARRQCGKSLELRATTSLARLLAQQDKRDEARAMLAEIYGWFTEGFNTADLKDAKALLDQLNK